MKTTLITIMLLTSFNVIAGDRDQGKEDGKEEGKVGRIIDNLLNRKKKAVTISYQHQTEKKSECESKARSTAEAKAKSACQAEYKKKCKLVGKAEITSPVEELNVQFAPVEKFSSYDTDKEKECEGKAIEAAKATALSECRKSFGGSAQCEIISSRVTRPVRRTVHTSTFGGRFKKYTCSAGAVAQAQVNGNPQYACTASATASAKKLSWRDLLK